MEKFILTTEDKSLAEDIQSSNFEGVEIRRLTRFFNAAPDPESVKITTTAIDLMIHYSGEAALLVFATWLNNKFKNKETKNTRINGIDISSKGDNVNIIVNACMSKGDNHSKKDRE